MQIRIDFLQLFLSIYHQLDIEQKLFLLQYVQTDRLQFLYLLVIVTWAKNIVFCVYTKNHEKLQKTP